MNGAVDAITLVFEPTLRELGRVVQHGNRRCQPPPRSGVAPGESVRAPVSAVQHGKDEDRDQVS